MVVAIIFGIVVLALVATIFIQSRTRKALSDNVRTLEMEVALRDSKIAQKEEENASLKAQLSELNSSFDGRLKNVIDTHMQNLERSLKEHYSAQERNIISQSDNLLLKTKDEFSKTSKEIMDGIFGPLKEQVTNYSKFLNEDRGAMRASIGEMIRMTSEIGKKADDLSQTLRGNKKIRGDFGELQLERVLESSGLIKGVQYRLQESARVEGTLYRPDAIIMLNDGRAVVVDAKFSLPSFGDLDEKGKSLALASNIKSRIDELSKKRYTEIEKDGFDSVFPYAMLFIPYQSLLDSALDSDHGLFEYAHKKNIYLVTPNTLYMGLKVISFVWINENRSKNVEEMLKSIDNFRKKMVACVKHFDSVDKKVADLSENFASLKGSFMSGHGNLMARMETLESSRGKLEL